MASENNYTDVKGYEMFQILEIRKKENHIWNPKKEQFNKDLHLLPLGSSIVFDLKINFEGEDRWCEVPIYLGIGSSYEFFNKEKGIREWRKICLSDTNEAWNRALKIFPDWKKWADGLSEGGDWGDALEWFNDKTLYAESSVNVVITTRTYNDGTVRKFINVCPQYEKKSICSDDEKATINKNLKAAGVKLFGKPKAKEEVAQSAPLPPKPKANTKTVDQAREEAFAKYQELFATDKSGAGFYPKCAEIIGRDMNTWESWTVADWAKITREMTDMPF